MPRRLTFPLLTALLVMAGATSSTAQKAGEEIQFKLTSFAAWTAPDRPLTLGLDITNPGATPQSDLTVQLTIRDRVRSRSALRASLDGKAQGNVLAVTTEDIATPLAPGETRSVAIERELGPLATTFRTGRARSGVYPLAIRMQSAGRKLAERFGAFVFIAGVPDEPMNLVWIMPVHRPAAFDSQNHYDRAELAADLGTGGRLRTIADALASHSAVPLTLAPTGLLLDQLNDVADGFQTASGDVPSTDPLATAAREVLERLRGAMASTTLEIATTPYARADLVSLVAADLSLDAQRQIATGRERVRALLGREPSPSVYVDGSLDADSRTARTLGTLGTRLMVLRPQAIRDLPEGRFGPDRPEQVSASGLSFETLLVDEPILKRMETATADPVLLAQGVLAETAAAYFELPALAAGRLMVLATDGMPQAGIVGPLLGALPQVPWLRLRTASDVASDAKLQPDSEPRSLHTVRTGDAVARLAPSRAARQAVETLDAVVTSPVDATVPLDRLILASESADYIKRPSFASALARGARAQAEGRLGQIVVPSRRVTLTARGGQLPVTILNRTPYEIRLRVRLDSAKVTFPHGAERTVVIPGRIQTVTFALEARTAGSFPIDVRLETVEGARLIGTAQVLVQSTAVSAVTLMATAGGALFLIGAWARRAISRRRKSAAAP